MKPVYSDTEKEILGLLYTNNSVTDKEIAAFLNKLPESKRDEAIHFMNLHLYGELFIRIAGGFISSNRYKPTPWLN